MLCAWRLLVLEARTNVCHHSLKNLDNMMSAEQIANAEVEMPADPHVIERCSSTFPLNKVIVITCSCYGTRNMYIRLLYPTTIWVLDDWIVIVPSRQTNLSPLQQNLATFLNW